PVAPHSEARVTIAHELRGPAEPPAGVVLALADALRPPFPPGGLWINVGPLRFNNAVSRVYAIEEVLEIAAASGFEVLAHVEEDLPYFASPSSGSHRVDRVSCFAARKVAEPPPVSIPSLVAPWVRDP